MKRFKRVMVLVVCLVLLVSALAVPVAASMDWVADVCPECGGVLKIVESRRYEETEYNTCTHQTTDDPDQPLDNRLLDTFKEYRVAEIRDCQNCTYHAETEWDEEILVHCPILGDFE